MQPRANSKRTGVLAAISLLLMGSVFLAERAGTSMATVRSEVSPGLSPPKSITSTWRAAWIVLGFPFGETYEHHVEMAGVQFEVSDLTVDQRARAARSISAAMCYPGSPLSDAQAMRLAASVESGRALAINWNNTLAFAWFFAGCLCGIWCLRTALTSLRRARQGRCAACGYDLRGAASPICPECGAASGQ